MSEDQSGFVVKGQSLPLIAIFVVDWCSLEPGSNSRQDEGECLSGTGMQSGEPSVRHRTWQVGDKQMRAGKLIYAQMGDAKARRGRNGTS